MYIYTKSCFHYTRIFVEFFNIFHDIRHFCKGLFCRLRHFCRFSGDMTGKESYYTVYAGHEVMYHVSTMLPYSKDNPQQLERKRHIGNDIVNIIYTDDPSAVDTFNPNCIRSQFTRELKRLYITRNIKSYTFNI